MYELSVAITFDFTFIFQFKEGSPCFAPVALSGSVSDVGDTSDPLAVAFSGNTANLHDFSPY